MIKTINIGAEYDSLKNKKLKNILLKISSKFDKSFVGPVGSQDIESWKCRVLDEDVMVTIETYIGIEIVGDEKLIEIILNEMNK